MCVTARRNLARPSLPRSRCHRDLSSVYRRFEFVSDLKARPLLHPRCGELPAFAKPTARQADFEFSSRSLGFGIFPSGDLGFRLRRAARGGGTRRIFPALLP